MFGSLGARAAVQPRPSGLPQRNRVDANSQRPRSSMLTARNPGAHLSLHNTRGGTPTTLTATETAGAAPARHPTPTDRHKATPPSAREGFPRWPLAFARVVCAACLAGRHQRWPLSDWILACSRHWMARRSGARASALRLPGPPPPATLPGHRRLRRHPSRRTRRSEHRDRPCRIRLRRGCRGLGRRGGPLRRRGGHRLRRGRDDGPRSRYAYILCALFSDRRRTRRP